MPAHNETASEKQVTHAVMGERFIGLIRFILNYFQDTVTSQTKIAMRVATQVARAMPVTD